ncbi:MAG: DNA replication/repair protein RecF [Defluviitaleaceae bacterium]|nr:DNA replication/repair protein RecF [Defluviitaleaceae bacterium]
MQIQRVLLHNFRNIECADVGLDEGLNIFFGDNAQGKTNFLEAVYYAAASRSHRASRDRELIMTNEKLARVKVQVKHEFLTTDIAMEIEKDSKRMFVNGLQIKRLGELFGNLFCVIFSPEDLSLVKSGPGLRRRFMDMELCQLYPAYYHNLRMYYKVMKQRNNLLRDMAFNQGRGLDTLDVWDEQLVSYGAKLIDTRARFVEKLSSIACKNQMDITGGKEKLEIIYKNNVDSDGFLEKLIKTRNYDIIKKNTSVGVHKDDMEFKINGKDARIYASQGQSRTAALSVKLAQVTLTYEERGCMPVLLLDDLLSELDLSRQRYLMERVKGLGLQCIITLTGAESAFGEYLSEQGAKIFKVTEGKIDEVTV